MAGDRHNNVVAREGLDVCWCGCKYWELDRCIDCGTKIGWTFCQTCRMDVPTPFYEEFCK